MTTTQTITEAQALKIISNEEAENLPYRVINAAGRAAVATWVKTTARNPERHNLDAWYSDAESAANNGTIDEDIVIEMRGTMTESGNPVTLNIPSASFDWQVQA